MELLPTMRVIILTDSLPDGNNPDHSTLDEPFAMVGKLLSVYTKKQFLNVYRDRLSIVLVRRFVTFVFE
jgi:hypothetical protein